jgi:disulfide bond formation protein DsbB
VQPEDVALFLGLLAVAGQVFLVVLVALAVGARWSHGWARALRSLRDEVGPYALGLAWAVAGVATLGSLYFSEVAHFRPCVLCWVQRTAMYPMAVILGVAWWRRDADVRWYALPLAGLGLCVSAYHVLLERVPSLESGSCDPAAPCTTRWVEPLGYLTIPAMAGTAFALVIAFLLLAPRNEELS